MLYQSMAYNVAYRILGDPDAAADATQDAFISAFKAMRSFAAARSRPGSCASSPTPAMTNCAASSAAPPTSLDDLPVDQDHVSYLRDPGEKAGRVRRATGTEPGHLQEGIQSLPGRPANWCWCCLTSRD